MSDTAFLEVQLYADGRKVALFGAATRPSVLPSSDYVGLINQDPRLATGEYAVDLSRFALRDGSVATWLAVYRGRPDSVLGDRGNYVGAGLWLLGNPLIAVDQVIDSLRAVTDRIVLIMDTDPPRSAQNLNAQLPSFAEGAIGWLRSHAIGGATDKDLGLPGSEGAPLDSRRLTVRLRNVFGAEALSALSAAMIARVRGGYTRMLLIQDEHATPEDRQKSFETLFGVGMPLNALNHHAVNYSVGSAARERTARESAQQSAQVVAQLQSQHAAMTEEIELLRQTSQRQQLDLQRAETAMRNEKTAHEDTRQRANEATRLRDELERVNRDFFAYKEKVRNAGQSPELADRIKAKVSSAVSSSGSSSRSSGGRGGGAKRVRPSSDVDFYQRNKVYFYIVLGVLGLLILGSMGLQYWRDRQAPAATPQPIEALPMPVPQQGVIDATADPNSNASGTVQPPVVDPAATEAPPPAPTP